MNLNGSSTSNNAKIGHAYIVGGGWYNSSLTQPTIRVTGATAVSIGALYSSGSGYYMGIVKCIATSTRITFGANVQGGYIEVSNE